MIKYILICTLLITGISYGQTVRVIDKSEKSAVLFDGDNPRSLVSIVKRMLFISRIITKQVLLRVI